MQLLIYIFNETAFSQGCGGCPRAEIIYKIDKTLNLILIATNGKSCMQTSLTYLLLGVKVMSMSVVLAKWTMFAAYFDCYDSWTISTKFLAPPNICCLKFVYNWLFFGLGCAEYIPFASPPRCGPVVNRPSLKRHTVTLDASVQLQQSMVTVPLFTETIKMFADQAWWLLIHYNWVVFLTILPDWSWSSFPFSISSYAILRKLPQFRLPCLKTFNIHFQILSTYVLLEGKVVQIVTGKASRWYVYVNLGGHRPSYCYTMVVIQ